ncbi:MAG: HAMP domain-containing sensor histidine kinase [Candidatus Thorarchaeota archaeon]|nr:HAMP domain-containing sensor histidine kinase [Candidatus Thorarchaeota archaeon]
MSRYNESEDKGTGQSTRYEELFNSSPMAYFSLSPHGIIQQVNQAAADLLGYSTSDLLKRNISSLFPRNGTSSDAGKLLLSEVLQGKEIRDLDAQMMNSESNRIWVSLTASLHKSSDSKISIGMMAVNVNRRKAAEARAKKDRERFSLVLEVMTHDLNNVNQSLIFSLGLVNEMDHIPEAGRNLVQGTIDEVRRAARMISNLKAIIDLSEKSLGFEWTDINSVVENAVFQVEDELPGKRIIVNTDFEKEQFIVEGHQNLQKVFFNILLNCAQFDNSDEVVVNISAAKTKDNDKVRITIEDFGQGIPDSLKEHIFRRSGESETQIVGRGLGLTLVDRIIASLGGSIWAEDRVEGDHTKGAKFVVMLQSWNELKILECGKSSCITFYKSDHCLFCDPTYEILLSVMDELGIPQSVLQVVNVDDPNSNVKEGELPMLPTTRICSTEITGFADVDAVRTAIMTLLMQPCYPY